MSRYMNNVLGPDVPMGLGMALAKDLEAMSYFSSLSPAQQQAIIDRTHSIQSKQEMQQFVHSLGSHSLGNHSLGNKQSMF